MRPASSFPDAPADAERFRALFRSSHLAMLVLGGDGRVTRANSAAERLLGWSAAEIELASILHPDDSARNAAGLAGVCRGEEDEYRAEARFVRPDGTVVWGEISAAGSAAGAVATIVDITARVRTETELRECEERFQLLVEGDPRLMFYTHDLRGIYTYASPSAERILGYSADELVGRISRFLHADEGASRVAQENTRLAYERGAGATPYPVHVRKKDGTYVYLEITESPILRGGVPVGMRGFARDVTEEKADREALSYAHQKLRLHVERSALGFLQLDPDGRVVDWNPAAEQILGFTREEIVGQSFTVFVPESLHAMVNNLLVELVRGSGLSECTNENVRKDGRIIVGEWVNTALINPDGELVGVASTVRDVTAEREASQRLREAEAHYRRLVETSPFGIYVLDLEGRILEGNSAAEAIVGCQPGEAVGQHFSAVVDPETLESAMESFRELATGTKDSSELETYVRHKEGGRRLVRIHASPVREGDRIIGTQGVMQDITEEREQHWQMQMLHTILERLPDEGVSITTLGGEILYANAAHARILGYSLDDPPANGIMAFLPPGEEAVAELKELHRALRDEGSWTSHARRRRLSDGEIRTVRLITGRVPGLHRDVVFSVLVDATEQLDREHQLRRAERLASVGTLVGGVAHELNNPLAAIKGFATLLTQTEDLGEIREWIGIIHREADRAARIVADLTLVARSTQERRSEKLPISLEDVIRYVLRVQSYRLRTHNVEVVTDFFPELPPILGDRAQMEQVVTNLVVNAQQALSSVPGKRMLRIRTGHTARGAVLHVGDTGPGISADKLDRIFDPFFSTKAPGEGTGLGLSLVHSIVTEHGGEIHVESAAGRGAEFRVTLPFAGASLSSTPAAPKGAEREGLRVLVVDDEAPIRTLLRITLTRRGHVVEEAVDGADALERIARNEGAYDVIVSDLRMPGLGGDQLLRRVEALMPALAKRLIFVTGDAANEDGSSVLPGRSNPVLVKPFDVTAAAEMIERHARSIADAGG